MKALIVALLCCAFLMIGGAQVKTQADVATHPGRYQIVMNPNVRADVFLLDTENGRIWKPIGVSDVPGQPVVWKFQERVDNQAELNQWLAQLPAPVAK